MKNFLTIHKTTVRSTPVISPSITQIFNKTCLLLLACALLASNSKILKAAQRNRIYPNNTSIFPQETFPIPLRSTEHAAQHHLSNTITTQQFEETQNQTETYETCGICLETFACTNPETPEHLSGYISNLTPQAPYLCRKIPHHARFHHACLAQWYLTHQPASCPICRTSPQVLEINPNSYQNTEYTSNLPPSYLTYFDGITLTIHIARTPLIYFFRHDFDRIDRQFYLSCVKKDGKKNTFAHSLLADIEFYFNLAQEGCFYLFEKTGFNMPKHMIMALALMSKHASSTNPDCESDQTKIKNFIQSCRRRASNLQDEDPLHIHIIYQELALKEKKELLQHFSTQLTEYTATTREPHYQSTHQLSHQLLYETPEILTKKITTLSREIASQEEDLAELEACNKLRITAMTQAVHLRQPQLVQLLTLAFTRKDIERAKHIVIEQVLSIGNQLATQAQENLPHISPEEIFDTATHTARTTRQNSTCVLL